MKRALTIDITTRDAQTLAALKRLQKELRDTGGEAGRTARESAGISDAVKGIAVGAGMKSLLSASSDLREAQAKNNAVFGESIDVIDEFAEGATDALGLSRREAYQATGTFGNMFVQLGSGKDVAADMSTTMIKLAGDFAAYHDANPVDVIDAQTAAFRGEYDALQRYVPTINAAAVEKRALADSGKASADQLTAEEKALATYNIMLENAGAATGAAAREHDGYSMSAKRASAEIENASASVGDSFAPAATKALQATAGLVGGLDELPGPLGEVAVGATAVALVGPRVVETFGQIATSAGSTRSALRGSVSDFGVAKGAALGAATGLAAYATAYEYLESRIKSNTDLRGLAKDLELIGAGSEDLSPLFQAAGGDAGDFAQKIRDLIGSMDESGAERFGDVLQSFQNGDPGAWWDAFSESMGEGIGHQAKQDIEDLDQALADFAEGSPEDARQVYGDMVAVLVEQGLTVDQISRVFPKYRTEIDRANLANEVGVDATAGHAAGQKELGEEVETAAEKMARQVDESTALFNAMEAVDQANQDVADAVTAVADAQDAVADAERGVAGAQEEVASAQERVADARRGVADAEESLADAREGVEDATRGVADAEADAAEAREAIVTATEDLATAQREATGDSDAMRDAMRDVDDAEAAFAQTQLDSLAAQEALTAAREGYGETMKDLATDVAAATDDVALAEIAIADAKERLAELQADPEATANERRKAEIAIRQAERRLEEIRERLAEAQADYDRNKNAGAEGSDAAVEAQEDVEAAADAQREAQERLEGAVQNVADTQVAANERVLTAQDNLAAAIDRRAQADQRVIDARDAVIDAQNRVRDATWGVEQANRNVANAVDGVRDAQQRVTDAKDAVVEARHAVRDAEQEVTNKLKDQAVKQFELDGKTRGAADATRILRDKLLEIGSTLDPNGAPYRNLRAYADLLGFIISVAPSVPSGLPSLGSSAPPGAQNAERSSAGAKSSEDRDRPNVVNNVEINFPDVTDSYTAAILTDRYLATSLNQRARAA